MKVEIVSAKKKFRLTFNKDRITLKVPEGVPAVVPPQMAKDIKGWLAEHPEFNNKTQRGEIYAMKAEGCFRVSTENFTLEWDFTTSEFWCWWRK